MIKVIKIQAFVFMCFLILSGCNIANHGSFTSKTFHGVTQPENLVKLGAVVGKSCQTQFLYLLPIDEGVSTLMAIEQAKQKIANTVLLADMIIDDTLAIEFGYSEQCIIVHATAMGIANRSD